MNHPIGHEAKEFVICECGCTKYYTAPMVLARCAYCCKPVWPVHPETKEPLLYQEVEVHSQKYLEKYKL